MFLVLFVMIMYTYRYSIEKESARPSLLGTAVLVLLPGPQGIGLINNRVNVFVLITEIRASPNVGMSPSSRPAIHAHALARTIHFSLSLPLSLSPLVVVVHSAALLLRPFCPDDRPWSADSKQSGRRVRAMNTLNMQTSGPHANFKFCFPKCSK